MSATSYLSNNPGHKILSALVTLDLRGEAFILIIYHKSAFHMVLQNSYLYPSVIVEMFSLSSGRHFPLTEGCLNNPFLSGCWEGKGSKE